MTDSTPSETGNALTFRDGSNNASVNNHAAVQTSTHDIANIAVVRHESKLNLQIRELNKGYNKMAGDLRAINVKMDSKTSVLGTRFNKNIRILSEKTQKELITSYAADTLATYRSLSGITDFEPKLTISSTFDFNAGSQDLSISINSELRLSQCVNTSEGTIKSLGESSPIISRISCKLESLPDVMEAHPIFFPDSFQESLAEIMKLQAEGEWITKTMESISADINNLRTQLQNIDKVERLARAQIAASQLKAAGMEAILESVNSAATDDLISSIVGDNGSSFMGDSGQLTLPVYNSAD